MWEKIINDDRLSRGDQKKGKYRKYTPWTLPRTRKDIFLEKGEWSGIIAEEGVKEVWEGRLPFWSFLVVYS